MNKINWIPDKLSIIPLYKQILDFIKNKISIGEWAIGSKLPTQMELASADRLYPVGGFFYQWL
jgi:GntR family transcriptional regulator of abcA and norABC